ncbi:MAG: 4Fe-4S binding protein [Candidatus Omnitrophota bacterium]
MRKLIIIRRLSQILFLGIFVYILWSTTYPLKGMISPQVLFKIDPLIMLITSVSGRVLLSGFIFSIIMILLALILGRFFCGWLCPLGTVIDAVGILKRKQKVLSDSQNAKGRKAKYMILGIVVFFALLGIQAAWVFDPIVLVARVISMNVIPAVTWAVDNFFIWLIKTFDLYGPVYDFYRELKASFLGVSIHYFANSLAILGFFLLVASASLFLTRIWCRMFCPLGALYALAGRFSFLERKVEGCVDCGKCEVACRMGAIREDMSYQKGECVLCMDCIYNCPGGFTRFGWPKGSLGNSTQNDKKSGGLSRREFLFLMISSLFFLGFKKPKSFLTQAKNLVIRPPGAQNEDKFLNACVRCGNCMKVCITNGLQPVILESGLEGMWTPQLVPEIGYCEYNCTLCGEVCPTQAIPALPVDLKHKAKLGLAEIDRSICIAWADDEQCIVCEEHCPVAEKAIKTKEVIISGRTIYYPTVDKTLCIGCGICQNKCPTRPVRAIRIRA